MLFRDLDVVERFSARASQGDFDIDALLGYLAGIPTYSLLAERALCRVLRGHLPVIDTTFPARLVEMAASRWRFNARFSLEQARTRARRGDIVGTLGQASKAIVEQAHANLCGRATWVLNEKGIVDRAGLAELAKFLSAASNDADGLCALVDRIDQGISHWRA